MECGITYRSNEFVVIYKSQQVNILDFTKDYTLENEKVKLIPLTLEHVEYLLLQSDDSDIWYYLLEEGRDRIRLHEYVSHAIENRSINKEYPFVVYDKIKNMYAGTTRFYDYSEVLKVVKLGHTWYGKNFRGTHINKNCKYLLLEFAFEYLELERVGFGVHMNNKISIAAMKSIGCTKEGVLRNFIPSIDGTGRVDIVLLSMLRQEWYTSAEPRLRDKLSSKA